MIYLITGTPGAGKSLYAVSTLTRELLSRRLVRNGVEVKRRLCVDGVDNLAIPHELLAPGKPSDDGSLSKGEGNGVWNWFEWCNPGDVIFIDEVQRWFRPRGMGTKVPPEIKHLETHRHMGVDFVLVTQNPMLVDQNIRRLVYRHQHIRRLFGLQRAVIYEWDGCAENVKSTKAAKMSQWGYPRSAYKLYHSSDLHTKPKVSPPIWAFLPILALVGLVLVGPTAFGALRGAMSGKGVASHSPVASAVEPVSHSSAAGPSPVAPSLPQADKPKFAGCIFTKRRQCACFDESGAQVVGDADMCLRLADGPPEPIPSSLHHAQESLNVAQW